MALDKQDIRRAFLEDEFFPFFQPLVNLAKGQVVGFEALARWNHAELGAIPPGAFLPVLHSHGLIDTLTQRLLEKVFTAAPLIPESLRLAINIAPLQFLDTTIPTRIADAAAQEGFALNRLTIEMTESALIENLSLARSVATQLKDLGCQLSLDDFGKGHSSFLHLQALPFDELKVDRSFVCAMTESAANFKIVSAIVGLGHSLGLATVAEGVETTEQAAMVRDMGCNLAQGWLFGMPTPAESLPEALVAPRSASGRTLTATEMDAEPCSV